MSVFRRRTTGKRPVVRLLAVLALTAGMTTAAAVAAPSAFAVGERCYNFTRTLRQARTAPT